MYSIPSHPIPSIPINLFPILSYSVPSYPILFCSFLFHFIPHCPIPPYFFLLMYSSVLLLFISTFTCSLPLTFLQLLSLSPTANHLLSYLTISLPHLHSVNLTISSFSSTLSHLISISLLYQIFIIFVICILGNW